MFTETLKLGSCLPDETVTPELYSHCTVIVEISGLVTFLETLTTNCGLEI